MQILAPRTLKHYEFVFFPKLQNKNNHLIDILLWCSRSNGDFRGQDPVLCLERQHKEVLEVLPEKNCHRCHLHPFFKSPIRGATADSCFKNGICNGSRKEFDSPEAGTVFEPNLRALGKEWPTDPAQQWLYKDWQLLHLESQSVQRSNLAPADL